eukprot:1490196-Pleurochrysis_carterae.AAC.1
MAPAHTSARERGVRADAWQKARDISCDARLCDARQCKHGCGMSTRANVLISVHMSVGTHMI